jgi:hypothetical protein
MSLKCIKGGTMCWHGLQWTSFFLNWYSRGGVQLGPLGTAATNGLLCQPRVIMMEKLVESLSGKSEVLGENLPQCRFVHTNPTSCPDANPGRRGGKPASNRLSYGTAKLRKLAQAATFLTCNQGYLVRISAWAPAIPKSFMTFLSPST